jgi:hypothetical protein
VIGDDVVLGADGDGRWAPMRLFRRRRAGPAREGRAERRAEAVEIRRHLESFVRSRRGVEAFVEPATSVTPPTVLLVAATGEWTRRRLPDPDLVRSLADDLAVPVYDVQLVGYPQRMRDWNEQVKRGRGNGGESIPEPGR